MKRSLRANLASYVDISDADFELFFERIRVVHFDKKELLLEAGSICDRVYYVRSGLIRYFHLVDGEERTGQFFFENSWYCDFDSYLLNKPSEQSIQAIEKSEVAVLQRDDIYRLYEQIPALERFGRLLTENAYIGLRKRTESFTLLTHEERYLHLVKTRPKVIARVPQYYIASYLGMKPQSLSRIRSRLAKGSGS